jgi:alkylation response protein AidB-like acyl-CoA dehydrogenase
LSREFPVDEPGIVGVARRLADELLFPSALQTDAAATVPVELLDAFADAGLYGISGPLSEGGLDADLPTVCAVIEALSSGCLTTTFVWAQHVGAVRAAAASENEPIREWVAPLCRGERRAGLALGGALPGPAPLIADPAGEGWIFRGYSPFVSGWGRIDAIHTAARTGDGRLVWAFVDARESDTVVVERLDLVALNATATVRAEFRDHRVPAERVTSVVEHLEGPPPPEVLRIHASFALGIAVRCCRMLGSTPLDEELAALRAELDRLDPATVPAARGKAGELALRAAAALTVARGSRSLLLENHVQRLMREAVFVLVYALRSGSRDAALASLGAASG